MEKSIPSSKFGASKPVRVEPVQKKVGLYDSGDGLIAAKRALIVAEELVGIGSLDMLALATSIVAQTPHPILVSLKRTMREKLSQRRKQDGTDVAKESQAKTLQEIHILLLKLDHVQVSEKCSVFHEDGFEK